MSKDRRASGSRAVLAYSALALAAFAVAGCSVGPKYARPSAPAPAAYKEPGDEWKQAAPSDAIAKGKWWEVYGDTQLNTLEEQVTAANFTLKAAQERFEQARAAVRGARSPLYPTVSAGVIVSGGSPSVDRPSAPSSIRLTSSDLQIPFDVAYEPDVWGRVRRFVEASRAEAQASAADLANAGLSLHAELALDYFDLRGLDAQKKLLDSTVANYQEALRLTQSRYNGGLASGVDVAQAQTQLETTRAQSIDTGVRRAADEHAIAVLTGQAASDFKIDPLPLSTPPPPVPAGLPSQLLERRPDIAASERLVAAANAQIGVARAAYFPTFLFTGAAGFDSGRITNLLQGQAGFWSLAGAAAQTIFDGGARRAATESARAGYNQSVDSYRQTVLTAFQEVEDNLAALRILEEEASTQQGAVAAAEHSLSLSESRYRGGVANYLEVITAQSAALSDERTALEILIRRMQASVLLIKALGGGWDASQLPTL